MSNKAIRIADARAKKTKLIIVTSNEERYNFCKRAFAEFNLKLERVALKLHEIQADTVKEVAMEKAITAAKQIGAPCICEDTEFQIESLHGFPGPFMKYSQAKLTPENIIQLLKNESNRKAIFKSILVYAEPNGTTKSFETKVEGQILDKKLGALGKGWDPIFMVDNNHKTLAQFSSVERFELWSSGYKKLGKWLLEKKGKV